MTKKAPSPGALAFRGALGPAPEPCPGHPRKIRDDAPEPAVRSFCPGCREWHTSEGPDWSGWEK